ncbi:unnamed protein product [Mytilus edulis]|uniref:MIR domain-containing protein n=1 Tax=Mytilus edulis TaxID=6550 RepID=A0A8S3SPB8_MYTED|nr:unnamed protein product [Mytilus edulis]
MGEYLCVGDQIALYSVETEGYAYSVQSSSVHSGLYIYQNQDREKPTKIPNPHAVVFEVCIQNRYKLNKKLRKLSAPTTSQGNLLEVNEKGAILHQAKLAAQAEDADNAAEQKRQMGKRVRYGEIVQLKHVLTSKYVHMCTSQTSQRDKNNMMIMLHNYNAKNAQFRILPQYKVKSEGEVQRKEIHDPSSLQYDESRYRGYTTVLPVVYRCNAPLNSRPRQYQKGIKMAKIYNKT